MYIYIYSIYAPLGQVLFLSRYVASGCCFATILPHVIQRVFS